MRRPLTLLAILVLVGACAYKVERRIADPARATSLEQDTEFLKAHMRDGGLYVLTDWEVDDEGGLVSGRGTRMDYNREVLASGPFLVPLDSVALFETNALRVSSSIIPLTVMTVGTAAVGAYCATNPKACFGSCPTFYAAGEDGPILAEGFSASVAPVLEDTDLDALPNVRSADRLVRLEMRNEALETHVVRWADLIAAPRAPGSRVYAIIDGSLREGSTVRPPTSCRDSSGDCVELVAHRDGLERTSLADSTDLATREWIDLEFTVDGLETNRLGVAITSRQSLLPTYVLYQGLAFMGTRAGEWLAALERGNAATRERTDGVGRVLGGIDVFTRTEGGAWLPVGSLQETGPLASDVRVLPIPPVPGERTLGVRLRLTRGMWRIDQIGLVALAGDVEGLRLRPARVLKGGVADTAARSRLRSREEALVTLPGDAYTLEYQLPDTGAGYELFLETRGYYLEWMRAQWLAEENQLRAARLFLDPAGALRSMAPEYKRVEPDMERVFWSSRYGTTH